MATFQVLNFLRNIRGIFNRTIRPRASYFLFSHPHRTTRPLSTKFGYDRGTPIDRYYIEAFLQNNQKYIRGQCLEITDNYYTSKFGRTRVTTSDVLDINRKNRKATIYGDLRRLTSVKSNTYDCFIATQTYVMIDDLDAAIKESERILKPGGILLVTLPCLGPVFNKKNHYWRFTAASSYYLFGKYFPKKSLSITTYGNALVGQAFWVGLGREDMTKDELEYHDPYFPLLVSVRATKK